ncbi:MAG TPA: serine/threonine-protein kinase [Oligoflexia bacterium]|nr:serine/threonine-protein kinase [Oligoflexia bacterium]
MLIIEKSLPVLEEFSHKVVSDTLYGLPFPIEVSISTADRLKNWEEVCDAAIIGPGVGASAVNAVSRLKQLSSSTQVLVCVTQAAFSQGSFDRAVLDDVRAVIGEIGQYEMLRRELLGICSDLLMNESEKPSPRLLHGRYEIIKVLGAGSLGTVYLCRHHELRGALVAMKILFKEVADDGIIADRFRNEIVASYGVSHPNVVRAYEYFRDGNIIAFTMEYVAGGSLADRLGKHENIEIKEAVSLLKQMASGVQAIHEAGIIHRDLKPENILLTETGDVKITDFGIARVSAGPKLSQYGGVVGTIDFVSPEYLERGQVDHRADVYALGVIGYEMITGEAPFKGNSVIEAMTLRLRTDPQPPSVTRKECPLELDAIVLKAMERNPETRYQSASELYNALSTLTI